MPANLHDPALIIIVLALGVAAGWIARTDFRRRSKDKAWRAGYAEGVRDEQWRSANATRSYNRFTFERRRHRVCMPEADPLHLSVERRKN